MSIDLTTPIVTTTTATAVKALLVKVAYALTDADGKVVDERILRVDADKIPADLLAKIENQCKNAVEG